MGLNRISSPIALELDKTPSWSFVHFECNRAASRCINCEHNQETIEWNGDCVNSYFLWKNTGYLYAHVILSHRCIKKLFNFILCLL